MPLPMDAVTQYVAVAAGLGTAAFSLVDATKAIGGGVSNCGFKHIRRVVSSFFSEEAKGSKTSGPFHVDEVLATLQANWLNGTRLADQKAIAKSLIKLCLDADSAGQLAKATGVSEDTLRTIATKVASSDPLDPRETDVLGRFDLMLTALLDRGYERADQSYRNSAKAWSMMAAVLLALAGEAMIGQGSFKFGEALLVGLIATPIAPVAKDLTSALQAGVKAAQLLRR
jgi:hypothetical protein